MISDFATRISIAVAEDGFAKHILSGAKHFRYLQDNQCRNESGNHGLQRREDRHALCQTGAVTQRFHQQYGQDAAGNTFDREHQELDRAKTSIDVNLKQWRMIEQDIGDEIAAGAGDGDGSKGAQRIVP